LTATSSLDLSLSTRPSAWRFRKPAPCLIISPVEMNDYIQTVIVAPMTTKARACPTRVATRFAGKDAHIVLDRIRTVGKRRLVTYLGRITPATQAKVLAVLAELFAE